MKYIKLITNSIFFLAIAFNMAYAQSEDCSRTTLFGKVEICLPNIDGYKECYLDPDVKVLADATEVAVNSVLGYYINNETYPKFNELGDSPMDDFFKVYGTNEIKDVEANTMMLNQMEEMLASNFITKNWDNVKEEIDEVGLGVEIGVPVAIKSYKYNDETFTNVLIIKYEFEGIEPYTMVMSLNGLLLNKRMVWLAYYLLYDGEESIQLLEKNTNKILKAFENQ